MEIDNMSTDTIRAYLEERENGKKIVIESMNFTEDPLQWKIDNDYATLKELADDTEVVYRCMCYTYYRDNACRQYTYRVKTEE